MIAATSLAEERVRGSLDVLMTTPMETWQIVIGKWLGTYRLVPPLAILPLLVVLGVGEVGAERWPTAIVMTAFVLSSGAAITSLGLAMATWCPRLGRAVGLTVSLYLLVTVGWLFADHGDRERPGTNEPHDGQPLVLLAGMMTANLRHGADRDVWTSAIFWTFFYALTALVLLAATLATFNRCLGRAGNRRIPSRR